ncbi:CRISPR system Cascade subunit CasA [Janthinobacterium sp. CG_23.3]|uniref:type I-E CRISPR-associated protein Cse1/CasA n=1 Tax=Janthinobacterium sp. CG_23.3 TaxID=3349634 RepID=UPI0038D4546B
MISLMSEKWLPVRRCSGALDWIHPSQISEPDIVAFAANRADFNGALAQLMIGLLQTAAAVDTESDWAGLWDAPPSAAVLEQWFGADAAAFVLDGDGARFMQDFSLTMAEGAECAIDALLIDAAGGSAIDKNTDHFVKRDTIRAMCPHCVATALFTLQTNAPAGGAGHRTSLRGGGPLTTLLVATPEPGMPPGSLWKTLWLNVKPNRIFLRQAGDAQKTEKHFTFPWLQGIQKIQAPGGETQPLHVHPHHVFWAMPRRIRLDFSGAHTGQCDICKRDSAQLVERYVTKPQGLNYKGVWRHPFSPYYESKEGWLPVHPQPGGFSYRNWLAWVLDSGQSKKNVQAATMVNYVIGEQRQDYGQLRLWVFGFDMDNMKPRCWYETTFPLYDLPGAEPASLKNIQGIVKELIEAAELAIFYLRQAVRQAWFGDSDVRGDLSFVDKSFWDATEYGFYEQLKELIFQARSEAGIDMDDADFLIGLGEAWLTLLHNKALKIFDADIVGAGALSQQNPRRIAEAYNGMRRNFQGNAIRSVLHLPVAEKGAKPGKKNQERMR